MKPPTVSVVTVCKNSSQTIRSTIRSIVEQPVDGLEYIIIDGGSNDGTQEIVRSFGNQVDICISEPDTGIADAFNKGISLASGDIVSLINSDDLLLPGSLQKVMEFFSNNPNVAVMHGDVLFYDGDHYIKRISPPSRWWLPWRMGTFNIHPATFVRKGVYEKYGLFDTSYKFAMDDHLFMRWLKAGVTISYVNEPFVRVQAGGLSGRYAFRAFAEKRRALLENGFSMLPANLQFATRCCGQFVVFLQQFGRRNKITKRPNNEVFKKDPTA